MYGLIPVNTNDTFDTDDVIKCTESTFERLKEAKKCGSHSHATEYTFQKFRGSAGRN